jgi:putative alpha-1,2-mannosidase
MKRDPQAYIRSLEPKDTEGVTDWCQYRRRATRGNGRDGVPRLSEKVLAAILQLTGRDPEEDKKESRASTTDLAIQSFSDDQFAANLDQIYTSDIEENAI